LVEGAWVLALAPREDERGFFARAFCQRENLEHGLETSFVQANVSVTRRRGTIRGLHYQVAPSEEAKLVRCTRGAVWDLVLDIRHGSPTCGKWFGAELTAESHRQLYVPKGCAHGYQTLADDTELFYLVSAFYSPSDERGIRWNDPAFAIDWPVREGIDLSPKDRNWPDFPLETLQGQSAAPMIKETR
jgi:dTDP-4-dehydrorhamnose 3,5-epimerase